MVLGLLGNLAKFWTKIVFWAQDGHHFVFMEVSTREKRRTGYEGPEENQR
jgi:hypothetical protein